MIRNALLLIAIFFGGTLITLAQTATKKDTLLQSDLAPGSKKNQTRYYETESGKIIGIGDTITLGQTAKKKDFEYVMVFLHSSSKSMTTEGADYRDAGKELTIVGVRKGGKGKTFTAWITLQDPKTKTKYLIQYENAVDAGEVVQ